MKKVMRIIGRVLCLAALAPAFKAQAAPYNPTPFTIDNAGESIEIQELGDERYHFYQTTDGQLIGKGADGIFYYIGENGQLSTAKAGKQQPAINQQKAKAAHRNLNTRTSIAVIPNEERASWVPTIDDTTNKRKRNLRFAVPEDHVRGELRFPVLLVENNSTKNSDSTAVWNLLNQRGYNKNRYTGSVKDYFLDQSSGIFAPNFDIYCVRLDVNFGDYKDKESQLIAAAIKELRNKYKDFDASVYDSNNDGEVDAMGVLYAGSSDAANKMGGYHYKLQWNREGRQYAGNNKTFNDYLILNQTNIYNEIDVLSSFIHEFSHAMGLKDHYSVVNYPDNPYPQFPGAHAWDVMSVGMYNNNGKTPAGYSAFEKEFMGWIKTRELTDSETTTAITAFNTSNLAYKIPVPGTEDEFYLLENRQLTGWDAYLPNHGLLIWHIDYDKGVWENDRLNDDETHQRIDVVEAGNLRVTNYSDAFNKTHQIDDPFPGSQNVTSYNRFKSWNGKDLGFGLFNITEKNNTIYFTTKDYIAVNTDTPAESGIVNGDEVIEDSTIYSYTFNIDLKISDNYTPEIIDFAPLFDTLLDGGNAMDLYEKNQLTLKAIEPNGNQTNNMTAIAPGQWFDADGNVVNYANGVVYAEYDLNGKIAKVGHYPNKVKGGDHFTITQIWGKGTRYAIVTYNITIWDPTHNALENSVSGITVTKIGGKLHIETALGAGKKTLRLFDTNGRQLLSEEFEGAETTIGPEPQQVVVLTIEDSTHKVKQTKKIIPLQ